MILLGRLIERSEHVVRTVDRIEARQSTIARQVEKISKRVSVLEKKPSPPPAETWSKRLLAVVAPIVTLVVTDAGDMLLRLVQKLLGH
jgi:hypothetical protein